MVSYQQWRQPARSGCAHPEKKLCKQTQSEGPLKESSFLLFLFSKSGSSLATFLCLNALKFDAVTSLLLVLFLTFSSGIEWLLTSFTLLQCFYSSCCCQAAMAAYGIFALFSVTLVVIQVLVKRLWINPLCNSDFECFPVGFLRHIN